MRLDLFLKTSRLIKHRTLAKKACGAGAVRVDGEKAKPSKTIAVGQTISIDTPTRLLEVRVINIPGKNSPKSDAASLYETLTDERKSWPE